MSAAGDLTSVGRSRGHAGIRRWPPWLWATPLAIAVAYAITLLVQLGRLVSITYLDADAASAPVIGQLFGGNPHVRNVVLGQMAWYSTLAFELATRWLPAHRQIWEAAPIALALASVALVSWGAWRVAGRWAAMVTGVLMFCASPRTLALLLSLNDHATTWFSLAVLGAWLIALLRHGDEWRLAVLAALCLIVGIVLGVNAASDSLLVAAGVVPFVIAVVGATAIDGSWLRSRALAWTAGTLVVALAAGELLLAWAHHENVVVSATLVHSRFALPATIDTNFSLWWQSIAVLANGDFFGLDLGFSSGLAVVCAVLAVGTVVYVPRLVWLRLRLDAAHREGAGDRAQTRPALAAAWSLYWGASLVVLSGAFILSTNPIDINSDRYLVGVVYAAAALVGPLASRPGLRRAFVVAATTIVAFAGLVGLLQKQVVDQTTGIPSDALAGAVARAAAAEHVSVGYAGYWDAAPITWATHFRVRVFPLQPCPPNLCVATYHQMSNWYAPRAERTFLLTDPALPLSTAPTPSLGAPVATISIGAAVMYVYPYDIGARVLP